MSVLHGIAGAIKLHTRTKKGGVFTLRRGAGGVTCKHENLVLVKCLLLAHITREAAFPIHDMLKYKLFSSLLCAYGTMPSHDH